MNFRIIMAQLITYFLICSCDNNETPINQLNSSFENDTINLIDQIQKVNYKIVKKDTSENNRIFVAINPKEIEDHKILSKIICQLIKIDSLDDIGRMSFFTKEEFANYKDEIFTNDSIVSAEYENWMNEYYYGEFDVESRGFTKYPASLNLDSRREQFLIPPCK